jgi:hypothetical protein
MKILITIFLTLLTFTYSRGQDETKQNLFKPFTIIILRPDNANISDSLKVYADSIENKHSDMYRASIQAMENFKEKSDKDERKIIDSQIKNIKERQAENADFKYYHSIAEKTLFELKSLFNSNEIETDYTLDNPVLAGQVIGSSQVSVSNLEKLGKRYGVDYIVSFASIHTAGTKEAPTLRYTVKLFWTQTNKEILEKEIEGNAPVDNYKFLKQILPPGNMHETGVYCDNYLECMIKSAVRFSTEELFKNIEGRQKK